MSPVSPEVSAEWRSLHRADNLTEGTMTHVRRSLSHSTQQREVGSRTESVHGRPRQRTAVRKGALGPGWAAGSGGGAWAHAAWSQMSVTPLDASSSLWAWPGAGRVGVAWLVGVTGLAWRAWPELAMWAWPGCPCGCGLGLPGGHGLRWPRGCVLGWPSGGPLTLYSRALLFL